MNPFRQYWGHENRFEGLCRMYVISSLLYYEYEKSPWPDPQYDNCCQTLAYSFRKLPEWFTSRVTLDDLRAGTGFALKPTDGEIEICEGFLCGHYDINTSF